MVLYAYDGASPFDLAVAKANGAIAITGYIVGNPGGFNPITKARVDTIRSMGMGFSPNWERAADAFLTYSVAQCQGAGAESLAACKALGVPDGTRVSFSIDTQIPTNRFQEMADKLSAAQAGMQGHYRAFVYGQSQFIDWLFANPQVSSITGKHWLMMSTWNLPYHPASPGVCMVQEHNLDGTWHSSPVPNTDFNLVTDPYALGAWWPTGSPYAGKGGFLMALSDAQQLDMYNRIMGSVASGNAVPQIQTVVNRISTATDTLEPAVAALQTTANNILATMPAAVSAADIVAAIKLDPPAGWNPTDAQLDALAAKIATAINTPSPAYSGSITLSPVVG